MGTLRWGAIALAATLAIVGGCGSTASNSVPPSQAPATSMPPASAVATSAAPTASPAPAAVTMCASTLPTTARMPSSLTPSRRATTKAGNITVTMEQGNGSSTVVQLLANKSDTFGYVSDAALITAAAQGAPVVSVASIDAQGSDAILCMPDMGITTIKDLDGKTILISAGAAVNIGFPVVAQFAGLDLSLSSSRPWLHLLSCRSCCKRKRHAFSVALTTARPSSRLRVSRPLCSGMTSTDSISQATPSPPTRTS